MSSNRRQHYVQQSYLRGFANGDTIRAYRFEDAAILEASVFDTNVGNVAAQRDLYTIKDGATRDDSMDNTLREVETKLPNILAPVLNGSDLTPENWFDLSMLAAIQESRKPGWVAGLVRGITQIHEQARALYQQYRPELTDSEIDAEIRKNWGDLGLSESAALDPRNLALKVLEPTLHSVHEMFVGQHACLVTSTGQDFVTSNSPVTYFDPTRTPSPMHGVDRSSYEVEVTFPLTRRHLLLISRRPIPPYVRANRIGVSVLNSRTVYGSQGEVYGYPHDEPAERRRQRNDVVMPRYGWGVVNMIERDLLPNSFIEIRKKMAKHRYMTLLLDAFEAGR